MLRSGCACTACTGGSSEPLHDGDPHWAGLPARAQRRLTCCPLLAAAGCRIGLAGLRTGRIGTGQRLLLRRCAQVAHVALGERAQDREGQDRSGDSGRTGSARDRCTSTPEISTETREAADAREQVSRLITRPSR